MPCTAFKYDLFLISLSVQSFASKTRLKEGWEIINLFWWDTEKYKYSGLGIQLHIVPHKPTEVLVG